MKNFALVLGLIGLVLSFTAIASPVFADVTGDFKVVSATYLNPGTADGGDAAVAGTVNHGAIRSGKQVVVEITYTVAYQYSTTETTEVE